MTHPWGQLNNGQKFGVLTVDLDRALARAGLNKAEATIMQHIREKSWHRATCHKKKGERWPDCQPHALDLNTLAHQVDPQHAANVRRKLGEARNALVHDRLLIALEGSQYLINKNVDEWTRLTAADVAYAAKGITPPRTPNGVTSRPQLGSKPTPNGVSATQSRTCAELDSIQIPPSEEIPAHEEDPSEEEDAAAKLERLYPSQNGSTQL